MYNYTLKICLTKQNTKFFSIITSVSLTPRKHLNDLKLYKINILTYCI